jgi:hypothetical protein
MPMLSDYVMWLATELHTTGDRPSINNLSAFAVEATDATTEQLSAIAVVVKTGYEAALENYKRWIKTYKWRISKLVNIKAV